jgi:hypothetical protein
LFILVFADCSESGNISDSCRHSVFAAGYLQFLFEPGVNEFLFQELQKGFVDSDFADSQIPLIPELTAIMEFCIRNSSRLAKLAFDYVINSATAEPNLVRVFMPLFPPLLCSVVQYSKAEQAMHCFTFLGLPHERFPGFSLARNCFRFLLCSLTQWHARFNRFCFSAEPATHS